MSANQDVAAAVVSLWLTPPAQQAAWPAAVQQAVTTMQALVPDGPKQPPMPARTTAQPDTWCELMVPEVPSKPPDRMTGRTDPVTGLHVGVFIHYQDVTLIAVGKRTDAGKLLDAMAAVYGENLGMPGYPALTLPSGFRVMRWQAVNPGGGMKDASTKRKGQDIWEGHLKAIVWSVRND